MRTVFRGAVLAIVVFCGAMFHEFVDYRQMASFRGVIRLVQPAPEIPVCYLCNRERNLVDCDDCKKDVCREHYIHDGGDIICIVDLHARQGVKRAATDAALAAQQLSPDLPGSVELDDCLCWRITQLEREIIRIGNNSGIPGYYIED